MLQKIKSKVREVVRVAKWTYKHPKYGKMSLVADLGLLLGVVLMIANFYVLGGLVLLASIVADLYVLNGVMKDFGK